MTIEEEIAQTIDKTLDGDCGYGVGAHLAAALSPLLNRVRAEAWFAGYDKGNLDGYFGTNKERENSPYVEFDPYREQNSEGNET